MNVFISGQQTETLFDFLTQYSKGEKMVIKASAPAFNLRNSDTKKFNINQINTPVFGLKIQRTVYDFLKEYKNQLNELEVSVEWELNTFVQKKKEKMLDILSFIDESESKNRLKNFILDFCSLSPKDISSFEDWNSFLLKHNITNWEDNLHFDKVLTLFGISEEEQKKLNNFEIGGNTIQQHSTRWIAKAIAGYSIPGCIVDLVNLVCAMTDISDPYEAFKKVKAGNIKWLPELFIHDGELDDILCLVVLRRHYNFKTVAQLPVDSIFDSLEKKWLNNNADIVIRDKFSTNQAALKLLYRLEDGDREDKEEKKMKLKDRLKLLSEEALFEKKKKEGLEVKKMTDSFDALLQSEIKELISELEKAAKRGEYYYDIPDTFKFKQSLSNGKIRDYFINYFQTEYGVNIHIGCGEEFMIDWVN